MDIFNEGNRRCDGDSTKETSNQSKSSNESDKNSKEFIQWDTRCTINDIRTPVDSEALNKTSVAEDADSRDTRASTNDSGVSDDSDGLNKMTVSEDADISDIRASTNDSTTSVDSEGLNKNSVSEYADNCDTRDSVNDLTSSVDSESNSVSEGNDSSDSRSSTNASGTQADSRRLKKSSDDDDSSDTRVSTDDDYRTSAYSEGVNRNSGSKDADIPSNNNNIIFSLPRSPDIGLMQKIAAAIPKNTSTPLKSIESAIFLSGLENEIKYVLVRENASVICCQLYVGRTLVATGRETTEERAKETAMKYGLEILTNLPNLPNKTLDDVKQELENWKKTSWNSSLLWSEMSSSDVSSKSKTLRSQLSEMEKNPKYADLYLILRIIEKLFDEKLAKNKNTPAIKKIEEAATKLKCASKVHFFHFGEDPDTPLYIRAFHCDFVINNIFICQSKACSKNKAKIDASEQGVHFLKHFIESGEFEKRRNVRKQVQISETNLTSQMTDISLPEFGINNKLLINSKIKHLVIFDYSTTSFQYKASQILYVTAIKCEKDLNYKIDEIPKRKWTHQRHKKEEKTIMDESKNSGKMIRCSITLNKEEIGKADGFTEKEAKSNAAEKALQFLQKNVYTIKVDKEIDYSLTISRSHVLNAENPSSVLDESNAGCKLLKLDVCPTCGGTGKINDITGPNGANDHGLVQDVSFSNNKVHKRKFEQKIKALLKDYSQSNTTKDLIFSTEFSTNERMEINRLAGRYNLSRNFLGKGKLKEKQLSLRRKFSPMELLDYLIESGGSTKKYQLEDRSVSDGK